MRVCCIPVTPMVEIGMRFCHVNEPICQDLEPAAAEWECKLIPATPAPAVTFEAAFAILVREGNIGQHIDSARRPGRSTVTPARSSRQKTGRSGRRLAIPSATPLLSPIPPDPAAAYCRALVGKDAPCARRSSDSKAWRLHHRYARI